MDGWESIAASAVPMTGGYGGETYTVSAAGEDAVLRLYLRDPNRVSVDVALMRLVRGILPVPRVLDAKLVGSVEDPPYVLCERLPGVNLETYLPTAAEDQRRRIGEQLGELLARLSGMPFLRGGMFEGDDLIPREFDLGEGGLVDWYRKHAAAIALDPVRGAKLTVVLAEVDDQVVLDEVDDQVELPPERFCLVHSDFNPKNLLVDPETAIITGLVDWEFAHSGSPYTDLGNLLRFCDDPVLAGAVLDVVRRRAPALAEPLQRRAREADLWALIELAGRAAQNPVAAAARDLLAQMAESGELAAGRPDLDPA
ncbi:phosphotransferase family protein [Kribbella deserti]|uniref:Phosphotransferase family protein n=1 Tax=Kribbella deserti TaxID=1926257 RepID=A0ABV6QKQ7_9ACTN